MPLAAYTVIADSAVDPDSPIDAGLMTAFRDNIAHLRGWIGASYTAGAVENHNHDGFNSAATEVGSNSVRNGSFEADTVSWTTTFFLGGQVTVNSSNEMDGAKCIAFTSGSLTNGGGSAICAPIACSGDGSVLVHAMVKASVAGVSGTIAVLWLSDAMAQISESTIYSTASMPTAQRAVCEVVTAPALARYYQVRLIGGFPNVGTVVGTVYFDGVFGAQRRDVAVPGSFRIAAQDAEVTTNSVPAVEAHNFFVRDGGTYRIAFELCTNGAVNEAYARIYVNGVAFGTSRATTSLNVFVLYSEDLLIPAGSTVQVFFWSSHSAANARLRRVSFGVANRAIVAPVAIPLGER